MIYKVRLVFQGYAAEFYFLVEADNPQQAIDKCVDSTAFEPTWMRDKRQCKATPVSLEKPVRLQNQ